MLNEKLFDLDTQPFWPFKLAKAYWGTNNNNFSKTKSKKLYILVERMT